MTLPLGHCPTRMEISVDWQGAHLVPSCAHGPSGPALCGASPDDWLVDSIPSSRVRACKGCEQEYRHGLYHVPCGPDHLLCLFGLTQEPSDPLASCRNTLRGLEEVVLPELGSMGSIQAVEVNGCCHADQWCAEHTGPMAPRSVSLTKDGSMDVGAPLHCQRGIPEDVETALYHAVRVREDREFLRRLGSMSHWDLYSAVIERPTSADLTLDHLSSPIPASLSDPLRQRHETNHLLYDILTDALKEWVKSDWARYEANRRVCYGLAGNGVLPSKVMSLCVFHVHSGAMTLVIEPAQFMQGGKVPPLEAGRTLAEWMGSRGFSQESVEDAVDSMQTMERTLGHLSQQLLGPRSGRIVRLEQEAPPEWMVWPHRVDEDGVSHRWLPDLLANILADALPTRFHESMSESTARAVLNP